MSSHYMQSAEWAHLRPEAGWSIERLEVGKDSFFAYSKKTPAGRLVYLPGYQPSKETDLTAIASQLKGKNNLVCKIEACSTHDPNVEAWFKKAGWKRAHNVQYDHTVLLDLKQPEKDLWMSMKARSRQEVNYAKRDGVKVEVVDPTEKNFKVMYDLLEDTSSRKEFGIRQRDYAMHLWSSFAGKGNLKLVFAKSKGKIIAGGVFLTDGNNKVWYKDAGSNPKYSKLFGPRLLLWETALLLKKDGFKILDLGGIPDPAHYEKSHMKGIYIFKTAFSREVTTMMPAYELPLKPLLYPAWQKLEPAAIKAKRKLSKLRG